MLVEVLVAQRKWESRVKAKGGTGLITTSFPQSNEVAKKMDRLTGKMMYLFNE
jgi:hypothetical protein